MSQFYGLLFTFLPLLLILWMANVAERQRERDEAYQALAILAYLSLATIYIALIFAGLLFQLAGLALDRAPEMLDLLRASGIDPAVVGEALSNPYLGLSIWVPALLGLTLLLPPVRRICARFLPIDPASPVHAVSLSFIMLIVINALVTVSVGLDQVAGFLAEQEEAGTGGGIPISLLWGQQLLMALMAFVGVGWLSRRSLGQVLARLDLVRPSGRDVLVGVAFAFIMVPMSALIQGAATLLGLGVDPGVEELTEQLIGDLFTTPWGILTLGLAAAIGEEPLFRGALQPRFGLVLTAILFAIVHSNYGISASTVLVLVLGLMLGWLRLRHNTTTSMIAHATYNMIIGLMAYLALQFVEF